jgi:glycosyltransferase involved in cell wall biosynthesis
MKKKISIIVSCYNEAKALPLFYKEIDKVTTKMSEVEFEFMFVDDGSSDNTLSLLKEYASKDKRVRFLSFSRNFGKEAAMYAGLCNVTGDYITLMDADLQDPPALLPKMYKLIKEGYDSVGTRRVTRKGEPPIRSFFARCFYKLINKMSKTEMVDGARDYRLMTRQVVDSIISLKEYNRYSKGLFSFVGYKTYWLEYENVKRVAGETKWSFWKLFIYAIDGIVAFTTTPLIISAIIGLLMCLVAFFAILFIILKTIIYGDPTSGWPSLVCIILLISGIQMLSLGVIGEYIAKLYLEVKNRPIYIIKETEKDL